MYIDAPKGSSGKTRYGAFIIRAADLTRHALPAIAPVKIKERNMTYNLAIGDRTYSSWSLRGWLLFAKFNIPVSVVSAQMYSPEFTKMLADFGGGHLVPALRHGDVIVTDTIAIAETLNEQHPDKQMWPADPAARGFARSIVAQMHSGFAHIRNDCTMNLRHTYTGFQPSDALCAELTRIETIWKSARSRASTGPWLFGAYSIADAFYAPVATRIATYRLPVSAATQAYIDTTLNDPAFKEWRAAGIAENYVQPGYDLDLPTAPWPIR